MREIAEFRINERFAPMLFSSGEGKRLSSVRKIEIDTIDPRFRRIGELRNELWSSKGELFFYGWDLRRRYSAQELASATFLQARIRSVFEPAGEECGTKYDESFACQCCGAGAKQIGPLFLNAGRIPRRKDFVKTIAGEIVVSRRVAKLFDRHNVKGIDLEPVRDARRTGLESEDWYQMVVRTASARIVPPTRVGNDPFDDDLNNEHRCPAGDLIGLNLLSEVSVESNILGTGDIILSRQFIGVRRGLLRPERVILISPKVRQLIESERLKGCEVEIAHLV